MEASSRSPPPNVVHWPLNLYKHLGDPRPPEGGMEVRVRHLVVKLPVGNSQIVSAFSFGSFLVVGTPTNNEFVPTITGFFQNAHRYRSHHLITTNF